VRLDKSKRLNDGSHQEGDTYSRAGMEVKERLPVAEGASGVWRSSRRRVHI